MEFFFCLELLLLLFKKKKKKREFVLSCVNKLKFADEEAGSPRVPGGFPRVVLSAGTRLKALRVNLTLHQSK